MIEFLTQHQFGTARRFTGFFCRGLRDARSKSQYQPGISMAISVYPHERGKYHDCLQQPDSRAKDFTSVATRAVYVFYDGLRNAPQDSSRRVERNRLSAYDTLLAAEATIDQARLDHQN